jgi:hypothetical protein
MGGQGVSVRRNEPAFEWVPPVWANSTETNP